MTADERRLEAKAKYEESVFCSEKCGEYTIVEYVNQSKAKIIHNLWKDGVIWSDIEL